ncbi:MAG TPA: undecaprenyldiphospho-muramoylpentapeptide beta-N-acetylglucosaminyltransferase [Bauldia sp.]|nr:undecaprenyldiphospho-muramoylpentapeptide beta-N-acetylglucosaminyltransferase [Bauldia sp.]
MAGVALIAAGGTGGHLFPAESLALALARRGWRIHLATDHRAEGYGHDFPAEKIHIVPAATITRSPVAAAKAVIQLGRGYMAARRLVRALRPDVAVGFGGYPTVPPMLAAARAGVPTVIHDQNAVLGRANSFLAPRVSAIAVSFARVAGAGDRRITETGNPVRPAVMEAASVPYPPLSPGGDFRLLIFGGSQGARFLSEVVPAAIGAVPMPIRSRIRVVQQCRREDLEAVKSAYARLDVPAELQPFFRDMPSRIAASHLVVCRSGASTVAELAVIGRPAIMVPLPGALDQDQKANAEVLAGAGGGWMIEQKDMTPQRLAGELADLASHPERLSAAAASARRIGRPDAVERLADLVERVARKAA